MGTVAVIPGVKRPERGVNHLPPFSVKVKETVELYYSPSELSLFLQGRSLSLPC